MKGKVLKSVGKNYIVRLEDGRVLACGLRGVFRHQSIRSTNPVVVGDEVTVVLDGEAGVITAIHDRRNAIMRKSVNLSKQIHLLAANVDQAILVVTMRAPKTSLEFIDRFLVSASAFGVPVIILVNKLDVIDQKSKSELADLMGIYEVIGYKVELCSATEKKNLQEVESILQGKTSVLVGHSGVGKSTLLNHFTGADQKVKQVSEQHDQGQHTTTFAEMFSIANEGFLIEWSKLKSQRLGITFLSFFD